MNLLSTFDFKFYDYNQNKVPAYASVLLFELWRRSSDQTPYVRVVYRRDGKSIDLSTKISGCTSTTNGCTFKQFYDRSQPYIMSDINAVSL
jgi:hypothetical protein